MEKKINARITELETAEKKTEIDLIAIRTVIGELKELIKKDK